MEGSAQSVSRWMDLAVAPAIWNARRSSWSQLVPAVRMTRAEGLVGLVMWDGRWVGRNGDDLR